MRRIKELKSWIEAYKGVETACGELELAFDFYKEEAMTEEEIDET